ncbi:MAG: hypothetical protein Q7S01_03930 [bacterium]|nr:hypothetical protein [bacterium]
MEVDMVKKARADFDLFHTNLAAYKKQVDGISNLLGLKGVARLRGDYLPTYFVGDIGNGLHKYALFSLNPGFSEKQNPTEETWKNSSWKDYENFTKRFFTLYHRAGMKSRYYEKISMIFAALEGLTFHNREDIYNFFQEHLINIDLLPYHSSGIGLPSTLSSEQREYMRDNLMRGIALVKNQGVRLALFNGQALCQLLVGNKLVEAGVPVPVNEKISIYLFRLEGIPCVAFSKFITQPFFKLKDVDFRKTIPKLIQSILNQ